ncbi:zinc metalloprotease [Halostella salina]|uniref:peptidase M10A and M12B matrixin and adamalysin n=1 Tax=Halostella salina TaxID=1547897 RepID=UPI000EF79C0B|nr:peptidase M10A and M12B matrixin and adamalysin [Halostella salina]
MNRRTFLKRSVHAGTLGTLAKRFVSADGTLDVRVWLSERAATHDDAGARAAEYVELAFGAVRDDVSVTRGGTVSVQHEHGHAVVQSGEWPRILLAGLAGSDGVDPVGDVNLLVTDGPMDAAPTGMGGAHVAAVGGARHLAAMPPAEQSTSVVPYSMPALATQVLLHECGHALGLTHDDGRVDRRDDGVVATPMLSSYAWTGGCDDDDTDCLAGARPTDDAERRLSVLFSDRAAAAIAAYDGETRLPAPDWL